MKSIHCKTTRCRVCGFTEIRVDEAVDRELVVMNECPRCDHRWLDASRPAFDVSAARRPLRVASEVASAA